MMHPLTRSLILACALAWPITASADGDAAHGKSLYGQCRSCHMPERNSIGPKHCDLIGRKAASVPGYNYSPAMKASGITWTKEALDKFLDHPASVVPGTFMPFAGIHNPTDRADLIAYLATLTCP